MLRDIFGPAGGAMALPQALWSLLRREGKERVGDSKGVTGLGPGRHRKGYVRRGEKRKLGGKSEGRGGEGELAHPNVKL